MVTATSQTASGRQAPRLWHVPLSVLFVLVNAPWSYWLGGAQLSDSVFNTLVALRWSANTRRFARVFGFLPNYAVPRTFPEKIQWRKLFDRNQHFVLLTDKIQVREFVGSKAPALLMPKLYWHGTDPGSIPFDRLDPPFIIKPNNRSGAFIVVRDKSEFDREQITSKARKWMSSKSHGWRNGEWAYGRVSTRILVEEFLSTGDNLEHPADFKIYVINGVVSCIHYSSDRYSGFHSDRSRRRGLYARDWKQIPVDKLRRDGRSVMSGGVPRPARLADMIKFAETLADDIDHLRVDLYLIGEQIYFGEMTIYAQSGHAGWIAKDESNVSTPPRDLDGDLGALWTLPAIPRRERLKRALTFRK